MTKFELQQLRDLPIEGVAERLGLRVERHKCLCPFHDDHRASLTFSQSRNTFRCWSCGESGGTIDLVMKYLNKDFKEACQWLNSDQFIVHSAESIVKSSSSTIFDAKRYEKYFEHPWLLPEARKFLFEERKLDERVVRWCRLSSWKDRKNIPWLQIPYYNRDGKLIGVQNRRLKSPFKGDLEGLPRFRFPRGSQCGIYNLPVLNRLKAGDELYIAEGCSDCWSLLSAGHKAIAIPSATLLTRENMKLLSGLSSSSSGNCPLAAEQLGSESDGGQKVGRGLFHMFPDNDAPGERLYLQLQKVLPNLQHHQLPLGCKDFSELYVKTLSGLPSVASSPIAPLPTGNCP